jgi:hypothetical protein
MECWCGESYKMVEKQRAEDKKCSSRCVNNWEEKNEELRLKNEENNHISTGCGGDLHMSVYSVPHYTNTQFIQSATDSVAQSSAANSVALSKQTSARLLSNRFQDVSIIKAQSLQSCTHACTQYSNGYQCIDALLSLISRNCSNLQDLFSCSKCIEASDPFQGIYTPGLLTTTQPASCVLSKGRYLRCDSVPDNPNFIRACVCQMPQYELN